MIENENVNVKNKLDSCFRKQKQSCLPHMSLDGINFFVDEGEIIN